MKRQLTHFDQSGAAHMVDISDKKSTDRIAIAKCKVKMLPSTIKIIENGQSKKGDVIAVARLAGIMAAKKTADIIPLCHPIQLSKVNIMFVTKLDMGFIELEATIKTKGKTGVEMEALTAVTVSALTIYDMLKSVDKSISITEARLIFKDGGKSGRYEAKERI